MRQTTLTERLTINKDRHRTNTDSLVQILQNEEELAFHAVMLGPRPLCAGIRTTARERSEVHRGVAHALRNTPRPTWRPPDSPAAMCR